MQSFSGDSGAIGEASSACRSEVRFQNLGQQFLLNHISKVDAALVSTVVLLAGLLLGISLIFWAAAR